MTDYFQRVRARYRYPLIILREMVVTDFKLRYQGSFLGYLWSLLKPLAMFSILYVVFVKFLKFGGGIPYYPVYLLLGIVIWGFFSEATSQGMVSLFSRADLLRKINFPRYVVVLSTFFSALINLCFNFIVVFVFMAALRVPLRSTILWMPLLFLELLALAISIAFFLSALYIRFKDLTHIWEVGLQGAFYATPILYPLSLVPVNWGRLLVLSPAAQIIQDVRYALITDKTQTISQLYGSPWVRLIPVGITVVLVVASVRYFRRQARYFAEEV